MTKCILTSCAAFWLLAGCAAPAEFKTVKQICVADVGKTQAMQITEDVLGRMQFRIDKVDTESGYIKTRPLPGAQFFEFWRKDNIGPENTIQANLHSIRRTVEVRMDSQQGRLCINCRAAVQRLSLPDELPVNAGSLQKLKLASEDPTWVDLGEDEKLTTVILKQIEKEITKAQKGKSQ